MKNILFTFFVGVVFVILVQANEKYGARPSLNLDYISVPDFVHPVPGGRHNYRSAQISLAQLDSLLSTGLIARVIRLNGPGRDAGGVQPGDERRLCEDHGVEFHAINAHEPDARQRVHVLLMHGQTLIHCRHGFDRTGALVGYHLRRLGYSRDEVIAHNGWENYTTKKGKQYQIYLNYIE